jgi:hypothetical protein
MTKPTAEQIQAAKVPTVADSATDSHFPESGKAQGLTVNNRQKDGQSQQAQGCP